LVCVVLSDFFFRAEDGIGDSSVTGVQTCALPIYETFVTRSPNHMWAISWRIALARSSRTASVTFERKTKVSLKVTQPMFSMAPEIGRASWRERGKSSSGVGIRRTCELHKAGRV